jgi:hypothetical protein
VSGEFNYVNKKPISHGFSGKKLSEKQVFIIFDYIKKYALKGMVN